jgi:hypothetical protein
MEALLNGMVHMQDDSFYQLLIFVSLFIFPLSFKALLQGLNQAYIYIEGSFCICSKLLYNIQCIMDIDKYTM